MAEQDKLQLTKAQEEALHPKASADLLFTPGGILNPNFPTSIPSKPAEISAANSLLDTMQAAVEASGNGQDAPRNEQATRRTLPPSPKESSK